MAKNESDIFICKLNKDDYWAYPSPFVAHGGGFEIQFRNLTADSIQLDLGDTPVHTQALSLDPHGTGCVKVNDSATPGLYEYRAEVKPTGVATTPSVKTMRKSGTVPTKRKAAPILVLGGSPPRIIVDT